MKTNTLIPLGLVAGGLVSHPPGHNSFKDAPASEIQAVYSDGETPNISNVAEVSDIFTNDRSAPKFNAPIEWNESTEARFNELATLEALEEATPSQHREFLKLQSVRRSAQSAHSFEDRLKQRKMHIATVQMIKAIEEWTALAISDS